MDVSDLRHAYAILELSPPITESSLKRQYKSLAKRWHPDRYQADPAGQAEAAEKLRNINIAYELVAASLESAEPYQAGPPANIADQPFSLSRDQVDEIVDSINRATRFSLLPEMSLHRWLSIGALVAYLVAATIALPAEFEQGGREIVKAVGLGARYFWLPLYLIWTGDKDSRSELESCFYRTIGWLLMALPAVVIVAIRIAVNRH